jgi:hypothetical protein
MDKKVVKLADPELQLPMKTGGGYSVDGSSVYGKLPVEHYADVEGVAKITSPLTGD